VNNLLKIKKKQGMITCRGPSGCMIVQNTKDFDVQMRHQEAFFLTEELSLTEPLVIKGEN
jgi:hypothetical protein